ncbi:MAG: DUF2752 domain-containing protein, partial [Lutimonas sp.]
AKRRFCTCVYKLSCYLLLIGYGVFLALHLRFNFIKGHTILQGLFILNVIIILLNYLLKFI